MTRLQATFHYSVRELVVEREVLGSSLSFRVEGHDVTITFPSTDKKTGGEKFDPAPAFDELFPVREATLLAEGARQLQATIAMSPSPLTDIDLLRVQVLVSDATFDASDFGEHGANPEVWERANAALGRASAAADVAVERLIAWIRVRHRQVWLGLGGEPPSRASSDEVVDLDAGRRLPWPARSEGSFRVVEREVPLNAERLAALRDLVEGNASPDLADVLLADARFVAETAEPPDPSRALLIVAVACEVKIKSFLRASAIRDQEALVELLLSHPTDWSLAAAALFDEPLKIVAGRSLKEDQRNLWKRIDKLFQRRNALAHRGKRPTEDEVRDAISASREVFAWLESLEVPED